MSTRPIRAIRATLAHEKPQTSVCAARRAANPPHGYYAECRSSRRLARVRQNGEGLFGQTGRLFQRPRSHPCSDSLFPVAAVSARWTYRHKLLLICRRAVWPPCSLSTLCTVLITHWEKLGDEPLAGKVWVAYGTSMDTETTAAAAAALASSLWRHFCFPMAVAQLADVRDLADLSQPTALGPHLSSRCWLPLHIMPMSSGPMHRPVSIQALDFGMHCAAVQRWR